MFRALCVVTFFALPVLAQAVDSDEIPINTSSELRDWCQAESEARFVGQGKMAYNWTARHFERGNTLIVEGSWRVDGDDVAVECRVARNARREYATLSIRSG